MFEGDEMRRHYFQGLLLRKSDKCKVEHLVYNSKRNSQMFTWENMQSHGEEFLCLSSERWCSDLKGIGCAHIFREWACVFLID